MYMNRIFLEKKYTRIYEKSVSYTFYMNRIEILTSHASSTCKYKI